MSDISAVNHHFSMTRPHFCRNLCLAFTKRDLETIMRALIALCFLIVTGLSAAAQQQPAELRALLTGDDSRGWEAVGRLNIGGRSMCTGALIAPNLVLTAAHCLYDRDNRSRFDASEIEFLAGLRHGRASAYRWVKAAIPHPDYVFAPDGGEAQVRNDLALLELERPIENTSITPFETSPRPRRGAEVGVVSYAHDRAETPALQKSCHVLARQFGTLILSCSVDFGSSGAPVFVTEDGIARIVSVVSAKAELNDRQVALATALDGGPLEELMAAYEALPDGSVTAAPAIRRLHFGQTRDGTGAKFVRP